MSLAAPMLAALALAWGCSTEESVLFGDKDCVAGGCVNANASSSSGSGGSGGSCEPDPACTVSYETDVFAAIIDGPAGCTGATGCHGGGTASSGLALEPGQPHEAYVALRAYQLDGTPGPAGAYIVPCDKDASKLLCNLTLEGGAMNPFGKCGSAMPLTLGGEKKLTQAELDVIAEWIECGAPEN